ncbi:MAG TPA: uracil-DNA glycosylase family protein [Rhodanobacteraceae bacterium]|nr:uracil-DNA glycosylase family protein [Rhodanobacteraceae bacterium]
MPALLQRIRACRLCAAHLPLGPRPVLRARASARLLIVGQAPGTRVHASGIPWNDPSGERLRAWLGIDRDAFYDEARVAIVPMGFCYPGKGRSGDLPPRAECAQTWHPQLLPQLPRIELTLLIGQYAQRYFLGTARGDDLTATVRAYRDYLPRCLPLPHPSPRNIGWFRRNPWFESEVLPTLRRRVQALLGANAAPA